MIGNNNIVDKPKKENKFSKILKENKKCVLVGCVLLFVIVMASVIILKGNSIGGLLVTSDSERIEKVYENLNTVISDEGKKYPEVNLPSDNRFKYTSVNEVLEFLNNRGDAVVYFGNEKCIYCRNVIQVLSNVAMTTEISNIYYLDTKEYENKLDDIFNVLGEEFASDDGKELYVPLVIFIADGHVVSYNKGTLFSQEDPYTPLDESQVQGLSEIYRYGIRDVINAIR